MSKQFSRKSEVMDAILDDVEAARGSADSLAAAMRAMIADAVPDIVAAAVSAVYQYGDAAQIQSGDDLNDYNTPGAFPCVSGAVAGSLSNCPVSAVGFRLEVRRIAGVSGESTLRAVQTIYPNMTSGTGYGFFYARTRTSAGWGAWYKYTGESVSAGVNAAETGVTA